MNTDGCNRNEINALLVETASARETIALGRVIGHRIKHPLPLLLYGDLGSGKTAFAQGLARGLDVPASIPVTSPTYTLVNEYPGRLPFYHIDLYRLTEPVDPDDIGLHEILDDAGVVVIEWSQRLHPDDRPPRRLDLFFEVIDDTCRCIRVFAYGLDPEDLLKDIRISASQT